MKNLIYPSLALVVLSLAACGGGGGGGTNTVTDTSAVSQPQSPAPTQTLASTPQVIDYYGDSTIRGYESYTGAQVATSAPDAFAAEVRKTAAHTVNNLGVDGQTSCQLLRGPLQSADNPIPNSTGGKTWAELMRDSRATVVMLNHGINDHNPPSASAAARRTPDQYAACLNDLARIARAAGKIVVFETPNPVSASGLEVYAQRMRSLASQQGIPLIDQHTYLTGVLAGRDPSALMPDGTHPDQPTYRLKGQYAAAEFQKIPR